MFRSLARPHSAGSRACRRGHVRRVLLSRAAAVVGIALPALPVASHAQASRLDEVVVTGTRTPQRLDQNLADVTVIDRTRLERAAGRTLAELLADEPGVQMSSNGSWGKSSGVYLRGLEGRHTLLLVDGVRYGSSTLGLPVWENIPLDSIERIEIVRGPMSGLYGSDAVGGVVQVFTRRGVAGTGFDASATAGSHGFGGLSAGGRFAQGDVDGNLRIAHVETRGFSSTNEHAQFGNFNPDDDGFRQDSGSLQLGWRIDGGWRADARWLQADGVTQYDDGPGADARAGLRTTLMSLEAGGPVTARWRTVLRVSRSKDDYNTLATASAFTPTGVIGTVQQQLAWENTVATPIGDAVLVAEHLHQAVSRPGAAFVVSERSIDGIAAGLSGSAGAHSWQGNLRHDHNSQFGAQNTGMLAYGYALSAQWRASASLGTSFVAPSFNQLYYPGFGNPALLPEEGRHAEIGLRWSDASRQLRATWFDNRIRGYISSGPAPTNIPRTRIDGLSLSGEWRVDAWTFAASADHVDPRNASEGTANVGKQLPRRAKNSAKASLDWSQGAWSAGASVSAFGERFDDPANTLRLGGYGTLDLRADWRFASAWRLGLRLNNAGGKRYETVYGYNQPGRELYLTLRYAGS